MSPLNMTPRMSPCNLQVYYYSRVRNKLSQKDLMPPLQSYEDAKAYFEGVRNTWNESQSCIQLKSTLESTLLPQCNKIFGFALGEFSREVRGMWHHGAAFQHAMLLASREFLSRYNPDGKETMTYAQDPAYSEVDKSLFADRGIIVLDDPEGFLQVDDSSAVISCGPHVPVKQIISDVAQPVLMIWDKVRDCTPQVTG